MILQYESIMLFFLLFLYAYIHIFATYRLISFLKTFLYCNDRTH